MFSKTKTARRTLATMAVGPLLAVSLVGCGDKNGGGEPSPEPSQSQESPSPQSPSPQSPSPQTTGAAKADPKFLEFMKNNVSSDYQVVDLAPHLQKRDVGAGDLVNKCPAVIYGAADLAKDGAQVVSATQSSPKQKAVTVLMYPSADKANAALEQVKQEMANPECHTVPVNGTNISAKPITDSHGFDNHAGISMDVNGTKVENLFATKGQFLMLMIGDLNGVVPDAKKVYDALPTS